MKIEKCSKSLCVPEKSIDFPNIAHREYMGICAKLARVWDDYKTLFVGSVRKNDVSMCMCMYKSIDRVTFHVTECLFG